MQRNAEGKGMKLTAGQAAKAAAVNTATITRAIKRGKISATKGEDGSWRIDPAELLRLYPRATVQEDPSLAVQGSATPPRNDDLRFEVAVLKERLRSAEALQAMAEDLRAAAEQDRDSWRAQAERLTKALPAPAAEPPQPKRRRWWRWG